MSKEVIELLQSSIESPHGNSEHFTNYLGSCIEHGAFYCKENVDVVVKTINTSLNSLFNREKGLMLLMTFLPQTTTEAFSNNAVSWMLHCNKFTLQKDGIVNSLSLKILAILIKLSPKFPEVSKETAKQIVPKFLTDHVKRRSGTKVSLELLECLEACMQEYSGPAGEFRLDILKLLLSLVESRNELVVAAARCVALVPGVGGAGKQGVSHKTAWQRQQMALVSLLHSLLNQLYEHVDCVVVKESTTENDLQLTVESIFEKNQLTKIQRQAAQFISVAQYLQAMLLEGFPVAKCVAPEAILDLILHAQMPTQRALGSSREALAILSVLPSVQVAALRLLEALVLCIKRNLIPQGPTVCQLCTQVIVWSHEQHPDWPYAMDKPFSATRLAAYCCLYSWLSVAGLNSQVQTVADKIVPVILDDIHTQKPSVKLKEGFKPGKGKRKQQTLVSIEDRSERLADKTANHRLCERGLLTLTLLVRAANTTVKKETYHGILRTVFTLADELPVPYSDTSCRNALYQLLLTVCLTPHSNVDPPLAPALRVFSSHQHHENPQIRSTCVAALSCLDTIIHPTAATLYFPTVRENLHQHEAKEEDGKMSESESEIDVEEVAPKRRKIEIDLAEDNRFVSSLDKPSIDVENVVETSKEETEVVQVCEESDDSNQSVEVVEYEESAGTTTNTEKVPESNDQTEENCVNENNTSKNETGTVDFPTVVVNEPSEIASREETKRTEEDEIIKVEDSPKKESEQDQTVDEDVSMMLLDFNDVVNDD